MDEQEKIEKRRHIRLIVTEILMSLSVLLLVGFLTLVVLGYSFNLRGLSGGGEVVERSGLVQVSSIPTGAAIFIDGESPLLLNTNASRTMLSGEHEIALKREGFSEWKKTIKVTEGLMYRLNYPRLFKTERETEEVLTFNYATYDVAKLPLKHDVKEKSFKTEGVKFMSVSPNHEKLLMLMDGMLYVMNLNENEPRLMALEINGSSGNIVNFTTITRAEWSGNSERVLLFANGKWVVVNVRDEKATVWLDEILANCDEKQGSLNEQSAERKCDKITVSSIKIESEAGDKLLILDDEKRIWEANVRDGKVSEVLISGVTAFDNDSERVVYLDTEQRLIAQRVGEEQGFLVAELATDAAKFSVMRYFQESYIGVAEGSKFSVYRKMGWVSGDEEMEKVFSEEVGFEVVSVKKRGKGMVFELVGANGEDKVFDIEAMELVAVDVADSGWIDEYLRFRLKDGKLSVFDYDGLNEVELLKKGVLSNRVVTISGNNRWLYYFAKDAATGAEKLVREKVI